MYSNTWKLCYRVRRTEAQSLGSGADVKVSQVAEFDLYSFALMMDTPAWATVCFSGHFLSY